MEDIINGLLYLYPDNLDLIADLTWTHSTVKVGDYSIQDSFTQSATEIYMNGGWASGGNRGGHQCYSPYFDITGFKTLSCTISTSNLGYNSGDSITRYVRLEYTGGTLTLSTGNFNVTDITGQARIHGYVTANGCGASVTISKMILSA